MVATNYLLCKDGARLMPAVVVGTTDDGLVEVASPSGVVYSAQPANVLSLEDGAAMLRMRRAEQLVAEGYDARQRSTGVFRVYCEEKHGQFGGYIVTVDAAGVPRCNCPSAVKVGSDQCKHALGLPGLLRTIAANKAQQRKAVPLPPATRIAPSPKLAAMLAHDGWDNNDPFSSSR